MIRRLVGVVLVVSVLMPIILGVASIFVVRQIVSDIEDVAREPLQRMNTSLNQVRSELEEARETFQRAANTLSGIAQQVQQVRNTITSILGDIRIPRIPIIDPSISVPTVTVKWSSALGITYPSDITIGTRSISIPIPDIPEFTVPIPGLPILRNAVRDVVDVVEDVTGAVSTITNIRALTSNLNDAVQQGRLVADRVQTVGGRWLNTVTIVAVLFVLSLAITYLALTLQVLLKGWQMITS